MARNLFYTQVHSSCTSLYRFSHMIVTWREINFTYSCGAWLVKSSSRHLVVTATGSKLQGLRLQVCIYIYLCVFIKDLHVKITVATGTIKKSHLGSLSVCVYLCTFACPYLREYSLKDYLTAHQRPHCSPQQECMYIRSRLSWIRTVYCAAHTHTFIHANSDNKIRWLAETIIQSTTILNHTIRMHTNAFSALRMCSVCLSAHHI